jgi:hypothetical protein
MAARVARVSLSELSSMKPPLWRGVLAVGMDTEGPGSGIFFAWGRALACWVGLNNLRV